MSSLNFTITATQAQFNNFADRLGYMSEVRNELDMPMPNPESRSAFLVRVMKERVSEEFYSPFIRDIDTQINTSRDAEKETMRNDIRNRVAASFTP